MKLYNLEPEGFWVVIEGAQDRPRRGRLSSALNSFYSLPQIWNGKGRPIGPLVYDVFFTPPEYLNMASKGHFSKQTPHRMHASSPIKATFSPFFPPVPPDMQFTGQFFTHIPHLVQRSGVTSKWMSAEHEHAGQLLSFMWASNSSLKYFIFAMTGFGAVWPRPQRDVIFTWLPRSRRSSISPSLPFPATILSRISRSLLVPTLHGVHLPQDSS